MNAGQIRYVNHLCPYFNHHSLTPKLHIDTNRLFANTIIYCLLLYLLSICLLICLDHNLKPWYIDIINIL